jgi:hypothetical protein
MSDIDDLIGTDLPREWLVIESGWARPVFITDKRPTGYIPRDIAEPLLGRDLGGDNVWFSREEGEKMRAHPEWRTEEP